MSHARRLIAFLALACLAGGANAQTPPPAPPQTSPAPQVRVPAPSTDTATGLIFPPAIAGIPQTASVDYGQSYNRADLGYSWSYAKAGLLSATLYLYTLGATSIPSGASAQVEQQLGQAVRDIYENASQNRYADVATARGPEDCRVGAHLFRCTTLTATTAKTQTPVFLMVMLTGYRSRYLKLRLDWLRNAPASQQAKDRFVQAIEATLAR